MVTEQPRCFRRRNAFSGSRLLSADPKPDSFRTSEDVRNHKKTPDFKIYPAYANFLLVKILKDGITSFDVFERCIQKGLMIRDCSSFQCLEGEYVRFCIQMPEENQRLLDLLQTI